MGVCLIYFVLMCVRGLQYGVLRNNSVFMKYYLTSSYTYVLIEKYNDNSEKCIQSSNLTIALSNNYDL